MASNGVESKYENVKKFYGFRAENEVNAAQRARIAAALGYDPLSTASVPDGANIGEGCGNPLLIANLAEVSYPMACQSCEWGIPRHLLTCGRKNAGRNCCRSG